MQTIYKKKKVNNFQDFQLTWTWDKFLLISATPYALQRPSDPGRQKLHEKLSGMKQNVSEKSQ